jgi:hypothetical protein
MNCLDQGKQEYGEFKKKKKEKRVHLKDIILSGL